MSDSNGMELATGVDSLAKWYPPWSFPGDPYKILRWCNGQHPSLKIYNTHPNSSGHMLSSMDHEELICWHQKHHSWWHGSSSTTPLWSSSEIHRLTPHPRDLYPPDPSPHSRSRWRNLLQNNLKYPLKECQGTVIMVNLFFLLLLLLSIVVVVGITKRGVVEDLYIYWTGELRVQAGNFLYSLQVQSKILTSNTTIIYHFIYFSYLFLHIMNYANHVLHFLSFSNGREQNNMWDTQHFCCVPVVTPRWLPHLDGHHVSRPLLPRCPQVTVEVQLTLLDILGHTGRLVSPRNLIPKLAFYILMLACPNTRSKTHGKCRSYRDE